MKRHPRRGYSMDRVAMVALPLVLLIFLLMFAKPKTWFNSVVDLPQGEYFNISDSEGEYAHIFLKHGKCWLMIDSTLRVPSLTKMGEIHKIVFNQNQSDKFSQFNAFGSSMLELRSFIDKHNSPIETMNEHFGIPIDSADEELSGWIKVAQNENKKLYSRPLQVALLCDKNEPYTNIKLIKDALRKDSIYRVTIIYNYKRRSQIN